MAEPRPPLLTVLRSPNQLRLLAATLLAPQRWFTVTELARATGVTQPTASREVRLLLGAGILAARDEHGRRVVAANTASPLYPDLASLLTKTVGPKVVLERLLSGVTGVERAMIYGSWARRYLGEPGQDPGEVDVMLVVGGALPAGAVRRISADASAEVGRDVNVTLLTTREWRAPTSGLLRQVKAGPLVHLDLPARTRPGA